MIKGVLLLVGRIRIAGWPSWDELDRLLALLDGGNRKLARGLTHWGPLSLAAALLPTNTLTAASLEIE